MTDASTVVVTINLCRTIDWNSKHPQFVAQSFNQFRCLPHRNEFTAKRRRLNSILPLLSTKQLETL